MLSSKSVKRLGSSLFETGDHVMKFHIFGILVVIKDIYIKRRQ